MGKWQTKGSKGGANTNTGVSQKGGGPYSDARNKGYGKGTGGLFIGEFYRDFILRNSHVV